MKEVQGSARLTDSPVVALNADKMMTPAMRRMIKVMRPNDARTLVPRLNQLLEKLSERS